MYFTAPMMPRIMPTIGIRMANAIAQFARVGDSGCTNVFLLLNCGVLMFPTAQPHPGQITASSKSSFPHFEQYFITIPPSVNILLPFGKYIIDVFCLNVNRKFLSMIYFFRGDYYVYIVW